MGQNKYDIFEWVKRVINSCETSTHLVKTNRLIMSFYDLHRDFFLKQCLNHYKDIKWRELTEKVKINKIEK